jgi:hypothetical protein
MRPRWHEARPITTIDREDRCDDRCNSPRRAALPHPHLHREERLEHAREHTRRALGQAREDVDARAGDVGADEAAE